MSVPTQSAVEFFSSAAPHPTQQYYQSSKPSLPMPPALPPVQPPPSISWVTHSDSPPIYPFPPPVMPPNLDASCRYSHLHNPAASQRIIQPQSYNPSMNFIHPSMHGYGGNSMHTQVQNGFHIQRVHQPSFHIDYGQNLFGQSSSMNAFPGPAPSQLTPQQYQELRHRPHIHFQQDPSGSTPVIHEAQFQNVPIGPAFTFGPVPSQQFSLQQLSPHAIPPRFQQLKHLPAVQSGNSQGSSSGIARPKPIYSNQHLQCRFEVYPSQPLKQTSSSTIAAATEFVVSTPTVELNEALVTEHAQIGAQDSVHGAVQSSAPVVAVSGPSLPQGQVVSVLKEQRIFCSIGEDVVTTAVNTGNSSASGSLQIVEQTVEIETEPTGIGSEDLRELEEYKEFAVAFRSERSKLGYSQADVIQQLSIRYGVAYSQDTLAQFEAGELPLDKVRLVKSMVEQWLRDSLKSSNISEDKINKIIVSPSTSINPRRERKRRILDDVIRDQLEIEFQKKQKPNQTELQLIADLFQIEKDYVRIWFCNRRQREKKQQTKKGNNSTKQQERSSPARGATRARQIAAPHVPPLTVRIPTTKTKIPSLSHDITVEVPSIDPRDVGSLVHQDYQDHPIQP